MAPTPGGPSPAAGAAPLSLQPGPPQQPVVVGGPPGALPGVAARRHAAARRAPGRAWVLTRAPSAAPDRPAGVQRSPELPVQPPPRPRLPHKVAQTPPPPPPPRPRAAGPAAGAPDQEAGLAPARKVSAGEIPAWSERGEAARTPGGTPRGFSPPPLRLRAPCPASGRPIRPAGVHGAHLRVRVPETRAQCTHRGRRAPRYGNSPLQLGSDTG